MNKRVLSARITHHHTSANSTRTCDPLAVFPVSCRLLSHWAALPRSSSRSLMKKTFSFILSRKVERKNLRASVKNSEKSGKIVRFVSYLRSNCCRSCRLLQVIGFEWNFDEFRVKIPFSKKWITLWEKKERKNFFFAPEKNPTVLEKVIWRAERKREEKFLHCEVSKENRNKEKSWKVLCCCFSHWDYYNKELTVLCSTISSNLFRASRIQWLTLRDNWIKLKIFHVPKKLKITQ